MARDPKVNFVEHMEQTLQGRVCFMGVGNTGYGDDGFGVSLAEALLVAGVLDAVVAGTSPDSYLGPVNDRGFDHLVFLDALDFGALPGSVAFLDCREIVARYPQVSTHKISLGLLAKYAESNGITKAWLLGVQPESLREGQSLTPTVCETMGRLLELLLQMRTQDVAVC